MAKCTFCFKNGTFYMEKNWAGNFVGGEKLQIWGMWWHYLGQQPRWHYLGRQPAVARKQTGDSYSGQRDRAECWSGISNQLRNNMLDQVWTFLPLWPVEPLTLPHTLRDFLRSFTAFVRICIASKKKARQQELGESWGPLIWNVTLS